MIPPELAQAEQKLREAMVLLMQVKDHLVVYDWVQGLCRIAQPIKELQEELRAEENEDGNV